MNLLAKLQEILGCFFKCFDNVYSQLKIVNLETLFVEMYGDNFHHFGSGYKH